MSVGEILLERGKIKPEHLQAALAAKKSSNERIDRILVRMGLVDEKDVLEIWGEQMSIDVIDLSQVQIDPELFKLMPQRLIHKKGLLPVDRVNGTLRVASADPYDISAFDELRMVTGLRIEPVLASESEIQRLIRQHFGVGSSTVDEMTEEESDSGSVELLSDSVDENGDPIELAQEATVVKLVNEILQEALRDKASDIHIEPYEDDLKIRYRIDGVLQQTPVPPQIRRFQAAIISRIKIMSNLNIAEKRLPQDGGFKARIHGREVDFRVSVIPTGFGEAVVLRILDRQSINLSLQQLGMDNEVLENFQALINRPHGIVLVTGPTGSGKTTTLYAALHTIVSDEIKILTIEDPIEYYLPGINQVQMHEEIGLTFAAALRSFLRQDPDIILVGEIRDFETAEIGIKAALTGHLVLSTLHTNDAPSTINRLLNMGIEPFLVASSVNLIVAQRLARKVCASCKERDDVSPETLIQMGMDPEIASRAECLRGKGCPVCGNTGFKGRVALYEVMPITEEVRELILMGASTAEIKNQAISQGMKTLRQSGLTKILDGTTSVSEILRTTMAD